MKPILSFAAVCLVFGACKSNQDLSSLSEADVPSGDELSILELASAARNAQMKLAVAEVSAGAKIIDCATKADTSQAISFVKNSLQGLVVDGAGGDLCMVKDGIYYCGKEALRAGLSSSFLGRWYLKQRGTRTSEEVIAEGVKAAQQFAFDTNLFVALHGEEIKQYAYRLHTDPAFQAQQALKIYTVLAMAGSSLMANIAEQSCDTLLSGFARVMGLISYEITLTVGFAILTAEIGGAGAAAKLGTLFAKLHRLANKSPKLADLIGKVIAGLRKTADSIMDLKYGRSADELADVGNAVDNVEDASDVGRLARRGEGEKIADIPCRILSLLDFSCALRSRIRENNRLVKFAEQAGSNREIQNTFNRWTEMFKNGDIPGDGKSLCGAIKYVRSGNGARLYYQQVEDGVEILGKSNKDKQNQNGVIKILRNTYCR